MRQASSSVACVVRLMEGGKRNGLHLVIKENVATRMIFYKYCVNNCMLKFIRVMFGADYWLK